MGKKSKSKNHRKKQRIKHIISGLYKIKEINHRLKYTRDELQTIIFKSQCGKRVLEELKEEGVTSEWLKLQGKEFTISYILLGCKLD